MPKEDTSQFEDFWGTEGSQPPEAPEDGVSEPIQSPVGGERQQQQPDAGEQVEGSGTPTTGKKTGYPEIDEHGNVERPEEAAVDEGGVRFTDEKGYAVTLSPEQVRDLHNKSAEAEQKIEGYDAFAAWSSANPDDAETVRKIIAGQKIEADGLSDAPSADEDPDSDDYLSSEIARATAPLRQQVEELTRAFIAKEQHDKAATDQRVQSQVEQEIASACESHPFLSGSKPEVREMVVQLAQADVRRYGHEGVTYEMAVNKFANALESEARNALARSTERAATPPVGGGGNPIVTQPEARTLHDGKFGEGLREVLREARKRQE